MSNIFRYFDTPFLGWQKKTVAHDGQEARICLDIRNWFMQKLGFPVLNKFEWFNVEFLNMG